MIFNFLTDLIYATFQAIFDFVGVVSIADIPIIGETLSTLLLTIITTYNAFIDTLPYAGIAMDVFIFAIIPFEIGMFVIKLLGGSRAPNHTL